VTFISWINLQSKSSTQGQWGTNYSSSIASVLIRSGSGANSCFYIRESNGTTGGPYSDITPSTGVWEFWTFRVDDGVARHYLDATESSSTYGSGGNTFDADASGDFQHQRDNDPESYQAWSSVFDASIPSAQISALSRGVNPFAFAHFGIIVMTPLYGNEDPEMAWGSPNTGTVTTAAKVADNPPTELLENYL